ncbi:MAG: hypothetical protein RL630_753 [Verrucomicrobiota bacterium]|jgi:hypothetical protein
MEIGFYPMAKSRNDGDSGKMKILRATASTDFCVTKDCRIVHHPVQGRKCLELGNEHWIPVVSWVRLHPERHVPKGMDEGESLAPDGFQELDSSEQVVWVEKPKREQ